MNPSRLSLILGMITILCWGSLATLGRLIYYLPPFYVLSLAFFIGALPGLLRPRMMFPGMKMFLWGTGGYYLYHFFLFYAFRHAPAIEANLINYMWPVLLVLMTPLFFREEKLRVYHWAGAALAVIGCVVLVMGSDFDPTADSLYGYLLAAGAAITWPLYSIGKKKMAGGSVWAVSGFCLGAGVLCLFTHLALEPAVVLQIKDVWKIAALGIGPFGIAFYSWDLALKLGNSRMVGALAYLTPVLSTLGLIIFAGQELSKFTALAMVLIVGGASFGLLDLIPLRVLKNKGDWA
jgi:drug/metabolite transporter (DMT)-like permease